MSNKTAAEKKAAALGARAGRLRKRLAGTEDATAARTLRKRVKRAQRGRRKALVEAAGGAKAMAKAKPKAD